MDNDQKKKYLASIMGSEKAEKMFEQAGFMTEALKDAGVENKEATEDVPAVEPVVEPVVEDKPIDTVAEVLKALDIEGLKEFVVKTQAEQAQAALDREKIGILESVIKELSGDRDEELAKMIRPEPSLAFPWSRPSSSDSNIIKEGDAEDKKLVDAVPTVGDWFAQATGIAPLKEVV